MKINISGLCNCLEGLISITYYYFKIILIEISKVPDRKGNE